MLESIWCGLFNTEKKIPDRYREEWKRENDRIELQSFRVLSAFGFLLVPMSVVLDYFIYPEHLTHFLFVRAIMSLSCLLLFGLSFVERLHRFSTPMTMLGIVIVGGGIAYMIRVLGYEEPYYAGLNLIYLASMIAPWGAVNTFLACFVVYAFYLIPILMFDVGGLNIAAFVNNNVFQLETIFIAGVVNHFQTKRRRREILNRLTIAYQAKALKEMDQFKREFISNVTHELKTPLAIVLGNAEIISEKSDDEETMRGLSLIRTSALQLSNHVDRILAVSSLDEPDATPDFGEYDYSGVVKRVFSAYETRAQTDHITFVLESVPEPLVVSIDIVQIEEVLHNLIQNAFKFTPGRGRITLRVSCDGEMVTTEVSDSGVGIPSDKLEKIFERMYQGDPVLSKRHSGIGLGLYICRKNVESHGGRIVARSTQGEGASFTFTLPIHSDQTGDVEIRHRREGDDENGLSARKSFEYRQRMGIDELVQITGADTLEGYENRNPAQTTVLIVEDNIGMMKVIAEALKDDYNLLLAFDAHQGLRKLEASSNRVSLVLSDIMLPGMNGFELCETAMKNALHRHIPLIFITALMSQEEQLKGYAAGATDYIVKPYSIKILKEKVDHWIARRQYEILLKEAYEALEARVKQLTRAKDIVLHEIGNPLQMIAGASYFIDKLRKLNLKRCTGKERQLWESSLALEHGIAAIRGVLETTRQLDTAEARERRPARVDAIVKEAVCQTRHLLGSVQLNTSLDKISGIQIHCDDKMLIQVLVNLIRNAVEAIAEKRSMERGRIDVDLDTQTAHHILIHIRDNGAGMDGEVLENIFTFKYTNKKNGTGIGLHLAKMILKLHDGAISVVSEKGEGTTFTLTLPIGNEKTRVESSVSH